MTLSHNVKRERIATRMSFGSLCALVACTGGCRCDRAPLPTPEPRGACAPAASVAGATHHPILAPRDVDVVLQSPGKEPRRTLRYDFVQGERIAFEVVPIERIDDPGDKRSMTIRVEGTVGCASPAGSRVEYRLGLGGAVHDEASAYAIVTARGVIERGGLTSKVEIDERGLTHPREGLPVALPSEPVGVGAVWQVSRTFDQGARQTTTYELVSMDDATVQTRTQVRLATAGGGAELMRGHGEATIELRSAVSTGWFLMRGPQGGTAGLRVLRL